MCGDARGLPNIAHGKLFPDRAWEKKEVKKREKATMRWERLILMHSTTHQIFALLTHNFSSWTYNTQFSSPFSRTCKFSHFFTLSVKNFLLSKRGINLKEEVICWRMSRILISQSTASASHKIFNDPPIPCRVHLNTRVNQLRLLRHKYVGKCSRVSLSTYLLCCEELWLNTIFGI